LTTTFVTRHQGAIDWAREEGLLEEGSRIAADYDPETAQPGEIVIGTLPAQLAARICERGGRYQHLTLDLSPELRGKELSAAEMRACNARLEEFHIQRSTVRTASGDGIMHVCIASDQTLQNLIPALTPELKATRIIILASERMRHSAERLQHGVQTAGMPQANISTRFDIPDSNLLNIVSYGEKLATELRATFPSDRILLNATGGTKLMSSGLTQAFRPLAEIIYCDTEHDRIEFLHPAGKRSLKLPVNLLKRDIYLAVQGFKSRPSALDEGEIWARASVTQQLAEAAPRIEHLIGYLNKAAVEFFKNRTDQAYLEPPRSAPERTVTDALVVAGLLRRQGSHALEVTNENAARYLRGGWLEEWCAVVAKSLETETPGQRLHPSRWGVSIQIDPFDHNAIPGRDQFSLNELDAVIIHRNKMLLVECKSGVQISDRGESQSILNRLEALGTHVGGRLDTKWLLTARRIHRNAQALQRAKQYGITIVTPDQLGNLRQLLLQWMRG
jgi:putative CRISPR-associated protein (TIGR02620 family)